MPKFCVTIAEKTWTIDEIRLIIEAESAEEARTIAEEGHMDSVVVNSHGNEVDGQGFFVREIPSDSSSNYVPPHDDFYAAQDECLDLVAEDRKKDRLLRAEVKSLLDDMGPFEHRNQLSKRLDAIRELLD